mgnify:FL=1
MRIIMWIILLTITLAIFTSKAHSRVTMLADNCVACHGENGQSLGPAIPNLGGMSQTYLLGAMLAYKYEDSNKLIAAIKSDSDFKDVKPLIRNSTVMARIAKGYTDSEIKALANYFSDQKLFTAQQDVSLSLASDGRKLHEKYCASCHKNNGKSSNVDAGVLVGQWKPYFLWTMSDYLDGSREMPRAMEALVNDMIATSGVESLKQLANYYASATP